MNSNQERKLAQGLRGDVLRANAFRYTHGIYGDARNAAGSRKIPQMLHELAKKIADNAPITINERIFLAHLLSALAEGFDVTDAELQALFGISEGTARNRQSTGSLPPRYKIGRRKLYKLTEVEAWIRKRRVVPGARSRVAA